MRPAAWRRLTMATAATTHIVHLPPQPTRLINQEDELALVRSLLAQDDVRLLTLIGPGGVGKTRLAIAAAEQVAERFPEGSGSSIWRRSPIPLCRADDCSGGGVREPPAQDPLEALSRSSGSGRSCWWWTTWSTCSPPRRTSTPAAGGPKSHDPGHQPRAAALRREHLFEVHPPVPGTEPAAWTVANLAATPAVQLFVARAQAADATFELSPANAEAVAELSRRLEGLPLAVELAAASASWSRRPCWRGCTRAWPCSAGRRPICHRHRSLHATLDWSYVLLTAHQQALFRRLAIFAGGFTLDGAEAVFTGDVPGADEGGDGLFYRHPEPPPRPPVVLDDLAALVDHGLVQPLDPIMDEPRYRMLETVRQFGLEQLAASGEEEEVRRRHLIYFVALAERLAERISLPEAERVFARLDAKHDDMRGRAGVGGGERGGGAGAAPGAGNGQLLDRPRPPARGPELAGAGAGLGFADGDAGAGAR